MRLALLILMAPLLFTACLELTPTVSTDFSETEARAVFQSEVRHRGFDFAVFNQIHVYVRISKRKDNG